MIFIGAYVRSPRCGYKAIKVQHQFGSSREGMKKKREREREKKKKNDRGWGSKGTTPGRTTKNPKNILRFYDFPSPRSFFSIFRTDSRSQNIGVIKSSGRCITKHIYIFKICRCLAHSCLWTWRAKQFDQFEKA